MVRDYRVVQSCASIERNLGSLQYSSHVICKQQVKNERQYIAFFLNWVYVGKSEVIGHARKLSLKPLGTIFVLVKGKFFHKKY